MLGKLMKYEFLAMGRIFLPMFGALIAVTLIQRALMMLPSQVPMTISTVVAAIMITAIFVATVILTIQRFRKNLLSEEGYLMMTLPVKVDYLILSKLFVAAICVLASTIVIGLAILILASYDFADISLVLAEMFDYIDSQSIVFVLQGIVVAILMSFAGTLLLYTCMALSMLTNKRRGLFSFGAFVVITTAMQILTATIAYIAFTLSLQRTITASLNEMSYFAAGQVVVWSYIAVLLAICAVFYFITRHMLKKKLNLQ